MLQLHMVPAMGDATLLRFCEAGNEINILIDGGNRKNDCIDYLKRLRVPGIDILIASHLDEDHIRGLRRIADEIGVKELWITDISPLIRPAAESLYMTKCFFEASLIVGGRCVRNRLAVYEGYEKQIGPFYLQVLSPPKSLHDYLRQPDTIRTILKSRKGQTIKKYVRRLLETRMEGKHKGRLDQVERRKEIVSEIVERFEVSTPQEKEIKDMIERDDFDPTYWQEMDPYYESARSLFNDISTVVRITYSYQGITKRFLFPGDLTNWTMLLAKYPFLIRNCILKVPHHGSEIRYDPQYCAYVLFKDCPGRAFFGFPTWALPVEGDTRGIYTWLAPERSLIYPLKSSFKLPKLGVRNEIINTSGATSCTFRQGRVDMGEHARSDSCIDCYNCAERGTSTILEWGETEGC